MLKTKPKIVKVLQVKTNLKKLDVHFNISGSDFIHKSIRSKFNQSLKYFILNYFYR